MRSDPILVTFTPSPGIQDFLVTIPLMNDDINEASEGFFVVIVQENITTTSSSEIPITLVRDGVTLVTIEDDDRKF